MDAIVSVVITTYKREMSILERAIKSVLNQTYKNLDIIVVNDYPAYKQKIQEMLEGYPFVRFISHESNQGACKARNDGVRISNGDYVAFLDDDDEWIATKIENQLNELLRCGADMVYCNGYYHNVDGSLKSNSYIYGCTQEQQFEKLLFDNFMGGCSYPLVKKSMFEKISGFDPAMKSCQDWDFYIRLAQVGKIVYLDERLVLYYLQEDSITSNYQKRVEGYYSLLEKHWELFREHKKAAESMYKKIALLGYEHRNSKVILNAAIKSFTIFPSNLLVLRRVVRLLLMILRDSLKRK